MAKVGYSKHAIVWRSYDIEGSLFSIAAPKSALSYPPRLDGAMHIEVSKTANWHVLDGAIGRGLLTFVEYAGFIIFKIKVGPVLAFSTGVTPASPAPAYASPTSLPTL